MVWVKIPDITWVKSRGIFKMVKHCTSNKIYYSLAQVLITDQTTILITINHYFSHGFLQDHVEKNDGFPTTISPCHTFCDGAVSSHGSSHGATSWRQLAIGGGGVSGKLDQHWFRSHNIIQHIYIYIHMYIYIYMYTYIYFPTALCD